MNTPAHAAINLLLLSRDPEHRKTVAVIGGALLPDLAIIVFYAWQLMLGRTESQIWSVEYYRPLWQAWIDIFNQIWSVEYYRPLWQAWIDIFNSIPLVSLAILLSWHTRQYLLLAFFSSMLLHIFGDLPLHHDDAHRHFFPLLEWRFESPVSYWDPAHHGRWASLFEFVAVVSASTFMYRRIVPLRPWVVAILAIYLLYWGYVYLVWI
jgi:hypothetical protein